LGLTGRVIDYANRMVVAFTGRNASGIGHAKIAAGAANVLDVVETAARAVRPFLRDEPYDDVGDAAGTGRTTIFTLRGVSSARASLKRGAPRQSGRCGRSFS